MLIEDEEEEDFGSALSSKRQRLEIVAEAAGLAGPVALAVVVADRVAR